MELQGRSSPGARCISQLVLNSLLLFIAGDKFLEETVNWGIRTQTKLRVSHLLLETWKLEDTTVWVLVAQLRYRKEQINW